MKCYKGMSTLSSPFVDKNHILALEKGIIISHIDGKIGIHNLVVLHDVIEP